MKFIYYTLSLIVWLAALFYLFFLSFKQKYKQSIPARFWLKNNKTFDEGGVWIHACSYGENVVANQLASYFSNTKRTVITQTGFELSSQVGQTRYLPFEVFLPFWSPKVDLLIVLEAELWLGLFASAKAKGAKTVLINARISDKSYPKYRRFGWYYKYLFSFIDAVYAQSEADKQRLESLGAQNVSVIGNLKSAIMPLPTKFYTKPNRFIITAASTHSGEEALILDAFLQNKEHLKNSTLVIVPRHPERFDAVRELIKEYANKHGFSFSDFEDSLNSDIVFVGKMGELINLYAISDCVLLGGGWANIGGHNPIEPAYFNPSIISGVHIYNQKETFANVDNIVICDDAALAAILGDAQKIDKARIKQKNNSIELCVERLNELLYDNAKLG